MKKKGFTLVELLGVITLLGIIALIAIPTISNIIKNSSDKTTEAQKKLIIKAARNYMSNQNLFTIETQNIRVSTLKDKGYLDNVDIDDIDTTACVEVSKDNKQFTYTYKDNCED